MNYIIQRQDSKTNVSNNPRTSPRPKWLAISGSWILYNYHIWFICIMFYSNLCETLNQLLITYGDMICSDRWPPSLTGLTPYHDGWLFCQRSPGRQSSQDRVWLDQNHIWILNLDPANVWWSTNRNVESENLNLVLCKQGEIEKWGFLLVRWFGWGDISRCRNFMVSKKMISK